MKKRTGKITRSISVRSYLDEGVVLIVRVEGENQRGSRYGRTVVFGKSAVPESDYRVTYEISKGRTRLYCFEKWSVQNVRTKEWTPVCFLPAYFAGHFLKRTVEIVKKSRWAK